MQRLVLVRNVNSDGGCFHCPFFQMVQYVGSARLSVRLLLCVCGGEGGFSKTGPGS